MVSSKQIELLDQPTKIIKFEKLKTYKSKIRHWIIHDSIYIIYSDSINVKHIQIRVYIEL